MHLLVANCLAQQGSRTLWLCFIVWLGRTSQWLTLLFLPTFWFSIQFSLNISYFLSISMVVTLSLQPCAWIWCDITTCHYTQNHLLFHLSLSLLDPTSSRSKTKQNKKHILIVLWSCDIKQVRPPRKDRQMQYRTPVIWFGIIQEQTQFGVDKCGWNVTSHFWVRCAAAQGREAAVDIGHMSAHGRLPTQLNSRTLSFEFHVVIVCHKILSFFSSFATLPKCKNWPEFLGFTKISGSLG